MVAKIGDEKAVAAVPGGTGSHAKMIFWWVHRTSVCSIGGSRLKLSEVVGGQALIECLTAACKALSLANAKGKSTNGLVIRSLDD